jgi:hypothetical protein
VMAENQAALLRIELYSPTNQLGETCIRRCTVHPWVVGLGRQNDDGHEGCGSANADC